MTKAITIEEIRVATGIQASIKRLLDSLEAQDLKPVELTKWARSVFLESRKLGHDDDEIANWIRAYANSKYYSDAQIAMTLRINGVEKYQSGGGSGGSGTGLGNLLPAFTKIALSATGVDETEIIKADYEPAKVVKLAENNLRNWASGMNEADQKTNLRWLKIVQAILSRGSELIEQRMKRPKLGV